MLVLKGLKGHDGTEGLKREMTVLKGLKGGDGTEGVKGQQ